jgi:hypothetical protein
MVDFRDNYETRATKPYEDTGSTGYVGPIIALLVIAVLIGSVFFFAGGSGDVAIEGAPAASETAPAADPAAPAVTTEEPVIIDPAAPVAE